MCCGTWPGVSMGPIGMSSMGLQGTRSITLNPEI
jgi:hypothetical protein